MNLRVFCNVYSQAVFKVSTLCTDTRCELTSPMINSTVNHMLLQVSTLPKFISVLDTCLKHALFNDGTYRIIHWIEVRWIRQPHFWSNEVRSGGRQLCDGLTCPVCGSRVLLKYEQIGWHMAHRRQQIICQNNVPVIFAVYFCTRVNEDYVSATKFRNPDW